MNKTKIIATIGPKVANKNKLIQLFNAGMSIARLNGAHNTLDWHKDTIKLIKKNLPRVPILLDIPGKKIRTKSLVKEPKFNKNDIIILTTDQNYKGIKKVPINNSELHKLLKKDRVYADDGSLSFIENKLKDIYCKALRGAIKSAKVLMFHMLI